MGTEVRSWMGMRNGRDISVFSQGKNRKRLSIEFGRLTKVLLRRIPVLSLAVIERTRVPGVSVALPRQMLLDALSKLSRDNAVEIHYIRRDCTIGPVHSLFGLNAALETMLSRDPSLQITVVPAAKAGTGAVGLHLEVSRPNEPKYNGRGEPNYILEVFIPFPGYMMADRQYISRL